MSILDTLTLVTPHLESQKPYGYRFAGIKVYHLDSEHRGDLEAFDVLKETHEHFTDVHIGKDNPHRDRIIWEIASHIEGNFSPCFEAILTVRDVDGLIIIWTPQGCRWWNSTRVNYRGLIREYLMGLRSLLDLLPR